MTRNIFVAAVRAADSLYDQTKVPAGVGLKPGTEDTPIIHVFPCDESKAAGFPNQYDGFEVLVDIAPFQASMSGQA